MVPQPACPGRPGCGSGCLSVDAADHPLVADLDQVRFIDSAGLAALVGAARRTAAHGGSPHTDCRRNGGR